MGGLSGCGHGLVNLIVWIAHIQLVEVREVFPSKCCLALSDKDPLPERPDRPLPLATGLPQKGPSNHNNYIGN